MNDLIMLRQVIEIKKWKSHGYECIYLSNKSQEIHTVKQEAKSYTLRCCLVGVRGPLPVHGVIYLRSFLFGLSS